MSQQKQTYATRRLGVGDMVVLGRGHPATVSVDKEGGRYRSQVIYTEAPNPSLRAQTEWRDLTGANNQIVTDVAIPSTATAVACRVVSISGTETQPRRGARMEVTLESGEDLLGLNHRNRPRSGRDSNDFECLPPNPSVVGAREWNGQTRNRRFAALDGAIDSRVGTVSFWIKVNDVLAGASGQNFLTVTDATGLKTSMLAISRNTSGGFHRLSVSLNIPNSPAISISTNGNLTLDTWLHLICSWENTFPANSAAHVDGYLDNTLIVHGVDQGSLLQWGITDAPIPYASEGFEWTQGSNDSHNDGHSVFDRSFDGCLSEFYVNLDERIDLSVLANRQKFRTAGGAAADLGVDGSTPTGAAPILYAANGEFFPNQGYGGDIPCLPLSDLVIDCVDAPTKV
jgi:hypothetical protein